jgi:flagellar biogenesis protein FliO
MSGKMQITPTAIDERIKNIKAVKSVKTEISSPAVDSLDEKYLQKLMQEEEQKNPEKKIDAAAALAPAIVPIKPSHGIEGFVKDKSSNFKKGKNAENAPSLTSQMIKFIFFTGLVLGIFYGLVYFMKRTVLSKGKLGFLGNANSITVLAQNYIAPKRSLMMVKVHNQVFLLSNCENGINFLSEISDTPGLIKQTVKSITGKNFDTNVGIAEGDEHLEEKVTLKEDIHFSKSLEEPSFKTKFAEQLKKKVKDLRPLNQ